MAEGALAALNLFEMLVLLVIYIAFIGLGLPDSLFGTAWPAIYADNNKKPVAVKRSASVFYSLALLKIRESVSGAICRMSTRSRLLTMWSVPCL